MKGIQLVCFFIVFAALGGIEYDDEVRRSGMAVADRTSQQMTIVLICGVVAGGVEILRRYRRNAEKIEIDPRCVIDGGDRRSGLRRV